MNDYYECYNFFQECSAFVIKHQNFLAACKRLKEHNEILDPKMNNSFIELFANVQKEMESTCNEHKCIINHHTDDESESDISDIVESEDSDENETDDDDDSDEKESNTTNESDNEMDDNESDEEDNSEDDEMGYQEDMADFFETTNCCIIELLKPFYDAMIETKQFEVIKKIQFWNDEYEQKCLRYDRWFSPHEKDESAMMMKEILFNYDRDCTNYFKLCESKYIKLLATYCKDVIDEKIGNKMFGQHYAKLIDLEFPLNKKRKLFTKNEIIKKLLNHIKDEAMPILNEYLVERHDHILKKIINS